MRPPLQSLLRRAPAWQLSLALHAAVLGLLCLGGGVCTLFGEGGLGPDGCEAAGIPVSLGESIRHADLVAMGRECAWTHCIEGPEGYYCGNCGAWVPGAEELYPADADFDYAEMDCGCCVTSDSIHAHRWNCPRAAGHFAGMLQPGPGAQQSVAPDPTRFGPAALRKFTSQPR